MTLLLSDVLPLFARELHELLIEANQPKLANQVPRLKIVERCRCGDDFCATFYTQRKPLGGYSPSHRNVVLIPSKGMLILDVVADEIACVEILYHDDIRKTPHAALP
jgi:hypothetical protein